MILGLHMYKVYMQDNPRIMLCNPFLFIVCAQSLVADSFEPEIPYNYSYLHTPGTMPYNGVPKHSLGNVEVR